MKKLYWKFRFARHFKTRIGLPFFESYVIAGSALENIGNDISECPIYAAEEEYYAWADCAK